MLMLFLTVALVHIVALMSPGPDFFFVSQTAVSRSRKEAMMGVLGITMGVMVWAAGVLLKGCSPTWRTQKRLSISAPCSPFLWVTTWVRVRVGASSC